LTIHNLNNLKKPRINNQITAPELRVISDDGENLGVISTEEALKQAKEKELDLIEISPTAKPPVAKIMDYGKFLYQEQKKEKEAAKKSKTVEIKNIKIGIGTSEHDLELKAKKVSEFLKRGDRVKIDLVLRGRAKYLDKNFIEERLKRVLNFVSESHKIADGPRKGPRGISVIIETDKK